MKTVPITYTKTVNDLTVLNIPYLQQNFLSSGIGGILRLISIVLFIAAFTVGFLLGPFGVMGLGVIGYLFYLGSRFVMYIPCPHCQAKTKYKRQLGKTVATKCGVCGMVFHVRYLHKSESIPKPTEAE